jgi:hypothetical protein
VPHFPVRQLCPQADLEKHIQSCWTDWRTGKFTDQGAHTISQHESVLVLDAARPISIFEINVWGLLFYGVYMRTDENSELAGININRFIGSLLVFIVHATKMFQVLGYSGPILLKMTLRSILEVRWIHAWEGFPQGVGGSALDEEVNFEILKITATEWEAFLDDFQQTLDKFKVPAQEQAELKVIVNSTRADIVVASESAVA